jgi:hypothetical protein
MLKFIFKRFSSNKKDFLTTSIISTKFDELPSSVVETYWENLRKSSKGKKLKNVKFQYKNLTFTKNLLHFGIFLYQNQEMNHILQVKSL